MADYIFVMAQGTIIEAGTHEELMTLQGAYSGDAPAGSAGEVATKSPSRLFIKNTALC